jgi:hypothetical protein
MERTGGVTAHVSPFAGVNDAGALLGRAGEALPKVLFFLPPPPLSFFVSVHVNVLLGRAGFSLIKVSFFFGKRPLAFALTERRRLWWRSPAGSSLDMLYMCPHAIDVSSCCICVLILVGRCCICVLIGAGRACVQGSRCQQ